MILTAVFATVALSAAAATIRSPKPGEPATLDTLPILPRGAIVQEFSSHNKHGVNGDAEWNLYKDEHGDAVVLDVLGPGCVKSIWETDVNPAQSFRFYFDGEKEPRYDIPVTDFFAGKHPLFPKELTTFDVVGRYAGDQKSGNCFVPIPFAKGLKVAIHGPFSFYHFIVERYPYGTQIQTFNGKEDRSYLIRAFKNQGEELEPHPDAEAVRHDIPTIAPGEGKEMLSVDKAGTVCRLTIECPADDGLLHDLELSMAWDESPFPNVQAPIGSFFGPAVRLEEVRSLPTRVEKLPNGRVRLVNYFRMPFWRHGRIGLWNRGAKPYAGIATEVKLLPQTHKEGEAGYFNAMYRDGRTEMGRDWLFAEGVGTGWYVGGVQTMFGSHYCEGDEHFTSDGTGQPQINGTGSEDYYLACYWPNRNFNYPFAGCIGDIFLQPGPGCYYRFHVDAPIPFYKSLDARIQHGGNSDIVSHYTSLAFYYLRKRPAMTQTDFIDVGNEASEKAHGYKAPGSKPTGELDAAYEGNATTTTIRDSGRTHSGGEIEFTVAVDPANSGVRLRRRLDQGGPRQLADVFVDGKPAGAWYHADENPFLRWFDSDYDLPIELTAGKKSVKIRLIVHKGDGLGSFTDFRYEAFSFEPR